MKKRQYLKLSMYIVVLRTLQEHKTELATVPALEPLIAELERLIDAIQHTARRKSECLLGGVQEKTALRSELETLAFAVSQGIRAYGMQHADEALKDEFGYSMSYLRRARQVDLTHLTLRVLTVTRQLGARLEPYGVTQERLRALEAVFTRYNDLLPWPRTGIAERSTICRTLEQQFQSADQLLYGGIDLLINGMPGTRVHIQYWYARRLAGAPRPKKTSGSDNAPGAAMLQVQANISPLASPS